MSIAVRPHTPARRANEGEPGRAIPRARRAGEDHSQKRPLQICLKLRAMLILMCCLLLALGGCGSGSAKDKPLATRSSKNAEAALEPGEILQRMMRVYRQARSYGDAGEVRLSYRQNGQMQEDAARLNVQFVRPNKLRVEAYQLILASDGNKLRAQILDPASQNLDHQIVVRPAPEVLSLPELYTDTVLYEVITSGLGRHPIQLELLLAEKPLENFLQPSVRKQLLEEGELEGRRCHRVQLSVDEGEFVFWIDAEEFVLRRLQYPTRLLQQQIAQVEQVDQLQLVADFHGAQVDTPVVDEAFEFTVPEDAKQLHFFVVPPQPLPSELFGQRPSAFSFHTADGANLDQQDLDGRIAVLMWFNNNPACQMALEQLQQVYKAHRQDSRLAFFVVCTEPTTSSNAELQGLLGEWRVDVPLVRDLEAYGRDVFAIPFAPTLVVLNASGQVEIFEGGANPDLSSQLPQVLQRLLAGEDLAGQIRRQYQQELEAYEQNLAVAKSGDGEMVELPPAKGEMVELPPAKLEAASEPQQIKLRQLWTLDSLTAPGNILITTEPEQILVHDGWQTVVEIDPYGELRKRHQLDLPPQAAMSYLRTTTDAEGRRWYAASALLAPQLFLLDDQWQVRLSYPAPGQPHDGLRDVQLADLDADGAPEIYAGYWGLVGVHAVSLEGQLLWSNRSASNILSLATTSPDDAGRRQLLVAQDRGELRQIDHSGDHGPALLVGQRQIHQLFAAAFAGGKTRFCGISYQSEGELLAVGLDDQLQEAWTYPLPVGLFRNQLQFVTSGQLGGGQKCWFFAGPNGTVHIVGHDGGLRDWFGYGSHITGLAQGRLAGKDLLLIASPGKLTAHEIRDF